MALMNNVASTLMAIRDIGCTTYMRRLYYTPLDSLPVAHPSSRVHCVYIPSVGSTSNVYYIETTSILYKTQFGVNYSIHHEAILCATVH